MQIPCTITRELFPDRDRAGRHYTVEFVHYANAATGAHVRTKANITPTPTAPGQTRDSAHDVEHRQPIGARVRDCGAVYLDAFENPAIRISVGYQAGKVCSSHVLAVQDGRVVSEWISADQFTIRFRECTVPPLIAARALESIGRSGGIEADASRYLLYALGAPAWRIALNTHATILRDRLTRFTQHIV